MILVYGGPTTGKSTAIAALSKDGYSCIDTDHLIEALVTQNQGLVLNDQHAAWTWWKEQPDDIKQPFIDQIKALIHFWRTPSIPTNFIVFTNLHWEDMNPDLAYFRGPALTLSLMKMRAEKKGQLISPSYEATILGWIAPEVGSPIIALGPEAFIDEDDIIKAYASKHSLQ